MNLDVVEQTARLSCIRLEGKLDSTGVDQVETRLTALLSKSGDAILDLTDVSFLSSLGVRLLITIAKLLDRRASKLVLVAAPQLVDGALKHSSLDEILPIVGAVEQAKAVLAT
ncbi:MAG: STAS domain-containing protein [Planctomycetes bacterium]|nr:STAS domain-containing protein [Planctomycetota bacterium]